MVVRPAMMTDEEADKAPLMVKGPTTVEEAREINPPVSGILNASVKAPLCNVENRKFPAPLK